MDGTREGYELAGEGLEGSGERVQAGQEDAAMNKACLASIQDQIHA